MRETGQPIGHGCGLLLIGRKRDRAFGPFACMRARTGRACTSVEEREKKIEERTAGGPARVPADVRLMQHELSRGMNLCRRSCERMPQVDTGEIGLAVSPPDTETSIRSLPRDACNCSDRIHSMSITRLG